MESTIPHKAVVVEDDPDTLELLCLLLGQMGLEPLGCPPNRDPCTYISHSRPALIVFDVEMGLVNGIDLFLRVRADPRTSSTPVIFFTADETQVYDRLPSLPDMNAQLVVKPNVDRLVSCIGDCFNLAA